MCQELGLARRSFLKRLNGRGGHLSETEGPTSADDPQRGHQLRLLPRRPTVACCPWHRRSTSTANRPTFPGARLRGTATSTSSVGRLPTTACWSAHLGILRSPPDQGRRGRLNGADGRLGDHQLGDGRGVSQFQHARRRLRAPCAPPPSPRCPASRDTVAACPRWHANLQLEVAALWKPSTSTTRSQRWMRDSKWGESGGSSRRAVRASAPITRRPAAVHSSGSRLARAPLSCPGGRSRSPCGCA